MKKCKHLINAINISKKFIDKIINEDSVVVDATLGNGNDALYMASKLGVKGKLYGFDIQPEAIKSSTNTLKKANLLHKATLIEDGHENLDRYITEEVDCVVFNLGYLPNGDKKIVTNSKTTICAINKSLKLLKNNGLISIIIYYGHEGGIDEKEDIELYLSKLNQNYFDVMKCEFTNQINNPPILVLIEKKNLKKDGNYCEHINN